MTRRAIRAYILFFHFSLLVSREFYTFTDDATPARLTMVHATILYLHRQTHPRTSRRVYWLRRVGRVVERVERAASGRSPWWEALNPHGAGPQDYTVSLFFFLSLSPFSFCPPLLSLSLLLSYSPSLSIVRIVGYNIQFIMYLWYMRTVAPEKWEAQIHDSHRLPALLPGKNRMKKNMKNERERGKKKRERTKGHACGGEVVMEETEQNRQRSARGWIVEILSIGSSPLDKTSRSKRPPFWCSTGWRAEEREIETERDRLDEPITMSKMREWEKRTTVTTMTTTMPMTRQGIKLDVIQCEFACFLVNWTRTSL